MPIIDREGKREEKEWINRNQGVPWRTLKHHNLPATDKQRRVIRDLVMTGHLERIPTAIYNNMTRGEAYNYIKKGLEERKRKKEGRSEILIYKTPLTRQV